MLIVMARILAESSSHVLVEPYGTYEDYYDCPNTHMHRWIRKTSIQTVNDEYQSEFAHLINSAEPLELAVSNRLGESLL